MILGRGEYLSCLIFKMGVTATSQAFCKLPVSGSIQQVPWKAPLGPQRRVLTGVEPRYNFVPRYKSLCPETWPTWAGRPQDGVAVLVRHLGYKPEEYKMGR